MDHRDFQRLAIEEARQSLQEKTPALYVGVVIERGGQVIASAHRGQFNKGDHAEYSALEHILRRNGETAANATVYTTLEPCILRGEGKIACAHRLVSARVSKVYVGAIDPNVSIRGGGIRYLQEHRIEVQLFDREFVDEIHALNLEFEKEHATAPGPLAPKVAGYTNYDAAADIFAEFLRLENLYMPRQELRPLFDRALLMIDGGGERIGWQILVLPSRDEHSFLSRCGEFITTGSRMVIEERLDRHWLGIVVTGETVGDAQASAIRLHEACAGIQPRLGIQQVQVGWIAGNTYVPVAVTNV